MQGDVVITKEKIREDFEGLVKASKEVMRDFPSRSDSEADKIYRSGLSLEDKIKLRMKNTKKLQRLTSELFQRTYE